MDAAFANALAAMLAASDASLARKARLDADPHMIVLRQCIADLDSPIRSDGMEGGRQMFASLVSPDHFRSLRAGALLRARIHQIDGYHGPALAELAKAASLRRRERLDLALGRQAQEHAEGRVGNVQIEATV